MFFVKSWPRRLGVWFLASVMACSLGAAELDAKRQAVIVSMFQEGAVLTENIHRDFWAGVKDTDPAATQAAMGRLVAALKVSLDYERASVLSLKASIQQRKPVVDPSYEAVLSTRLDMIRARNSSPDTVLAKDKAFREILVPVSKGKRFERDGKTVLITMAVADEALKRIEASYLRLERLLNPVWVNSGG